MPEERLEERSEPATPRRRREARERGHVARSHDLASAAILLAAVLTFEVVGRAYVGGLSAAVAGVLGRLSEAGAGGESPLALYGGAASAAFLGLLPFVVVVAAAATGIHLIQVGFLWTGRPLVPQPERLDPVEGFRRIFSGRSLARLAAGALKTAVIAAAVLLTVWSERARLLGLSGAGFEEAAKYASGAVLLMSLRVSAALLVLGMLDYGYQRWLYERDLRMSRAEVREELKRYEGDPAVRERRRRIQRRLALERMLLLVPRATVVVTNPVHVAVALEYDPAGDGPPVVTAKGTEMMAGRIREAAMDHGVPVVERPDLARSLYRKVEVGGTVPPELFDDVADVVALALRMRGAAAAA